MRISDWSSDVCSSDLLVLAQRHNVTLACIGERSLHPRVIAIQEREPLIATWLERHRCNAALVRPDHVVFGTSAHMTRSEEHTSELQSLMRISYAVFCLKKKKNKQFIYYHKIADPQHINSIQSAT